ncbi:MAG: hypothetical protein U0441_15000 [Polyangiaceae bacterium]
MRKPPAISPNPAASRRCPAARTALFTCTAAFLVSACSGPPGALQGPESSQGASTPPVPTSPPADSIAPRPPTALFAGPPSVLAAATSAGGWALIDAETGAILDAAPPSDLGGERDAAWDPWQSRLLVFESDAEGTWGEVASYPVESAFGGRRHEVWIDGRARIAASPHGAVLFEESAGPRWRLVRTDGQPSASVFGPRPMSIFPEPREDGSFRLTALTYGVDDATPDLRVAKVDPTGITPLVTVPILVEPLTEDASPRWFVANDTGHLVAAANGDVWLTPTAGSGFPPWMPAGLGPDIDRVTSAVPFPSGDRLALTVTGPFDVAVVTLASAGAPACAAALDLPGEMGGAPLFFERPLVVLSETRLLAATTEGVFAVTVSSDCPPSLAIDLSFEGDSLRAPLVPVTD